MYASSSLGFSRATVSSVPPKSPTPQQQHIHDEWCCEPAMPIPLQRFRITSSGKRFLNMDVLTCFNVPKAPFPVTPTLHRPRFLCSLPQRKSNRPFFLNTTLIRNAPRSLPENLHNILNLPVLFLPFWRDRPLIHQTSEPVFWKSDQLRDFLVTTPNPLTVPLSKTGPPATQYFAIDVSQSKKPPVATGEHAVSLRAVLPSLSEFHAYLVCHGKALLSWHASTVFCSRCGTRTEVTQAGAARLCPNQCCKTRNIYPRIMPSIMAAVTRPETDSILLGRKSSWPRGRYSVLAGFAEIFECLEDTVVREVCEETGVVVQRDTVHYVASQPWPSSPHASLMSGFRAEVWGDHNARIVIDEDELENARWFERDELQHGLDSRSIDIPGRTSLARRLILDWLHEKRILSHCGEFDTSSNNGQH